MKLTISTFLSVLFISANVKAELGEKCEGRRTYNGTCVYLDSCEHFLNLVKNYESFGLKHEEVITILRQAHCGYVLNKALVCCPDNNGTVSQTPNTNIPPDNSGSKGQDLGSQPLNPPTSNVSDNDSAQKNPSSPIANKPSPEALPTDTPTVGLTPSSGVVNAPPNQSNGIPNPIPTTTAAAPQTTTKAPSNPITDNEKHKLLPKECGRILMFKYFHGNRTEFDDFPWATLIQYETPTGKTFACGGALIHKKYVLTAAHCIKDILPSWKVSGVRFGEYNTDTEDDCIPDGPNIVICNDKPIDVAVEETIAHPGYNSNDPSRFNDIALLRLASPVNFTDVVKPICLPTKRPFPQRFYITGWGKNLDKELGQVSSRNGTNLKYMSYVTTIDRKVCKEQYAKAGVQISDSYICGGARPYEKPCLGDGGGPLMGLEEINNLEKRVTAFGVFTLNKLVTNDCQNSDYPGVYTKVLDYMDWILGQLRE